MNLREAQQSLSQFVALLVIDTPAGRVRLGDVLADYQADFFRDIEPALLRLVGRDVPCQWRRFFSEWPRGHAKTFCLAVVILWLIVASRKKLTGIGAGGDKDQARLLRDSVADIVRTNPTLESVVNVAAYKIENRYTGTVFEILSSDAATSYGVAPDIVVADELVHWQSAELWHSLFSSAAKKSNSVLCVISNAGWKHSQWWPIRENIRNDPAWRFSRLEGPQAPWITESDLLEQRRHLPPDVFARLWLNQPTDGVGSSALEAGDIEAAVTLRGAASDREPGRVYVGGLDLGLKRDHSALVVLAKHVGYSERIAKPLPVYNSTTRALIDTGCIDAPPEHVTYRNHPGTGRVELVAVRTWNPQAGRIEIESIEREILALHQRFGLSLLAFDVWQGEFLGQRLQRAGLAVDPITYTPAILQQLATTTLDCFRERQINLFRHDGLLTDLRSLQVIEKSYGYRLQSPRDDAGHGDIAAALQLALHGAKVIRSSVGFSQRQLVLN